MAQVYTAVLKPASGGFGEWDWVESVRQEGCEDYLDYEDSIGDDCSGFWVTDELSGRIHRERGRVYRIEHGHGSVNRTVTYEMVWIEDE